MANPQAIQVHCDGAMDYDPKQTGGNGYKVEFPDFLKTEAISKFIRNDGQGIHRLEMISVLEAMEEIIFWAKANKEIAKQVAGAEIYTDRFSVTDEELTNPYKVREWRKNGWKNHEGKPIKNKDLLDKIDKTRIKLSQAVGGRITISFVRRKKNRLADKLAKQGKVSKLRGRKLIDKKRRNVTKRLYEGCEVKYEKLKEEDVFCGRVYAHERIGEEYEVCFECHEEPFKGEVIKAYVSFNEKARLHRSHNYIIEIDSVYRNYIRISSIKEI